MSQIKIEQDGWTTSIVVDGVPLQNVVGAASVRFEPNNLPVVDLQLVAFGNSMTLADGQLTVSGMQAPQELELALLAHLQAKYQARGLLELPVVSKAAEAPFVPGAAAFDAMAERVAHNGERILVKLESIQEATALQPVPGWKIAAGVLGEMFCYGFDSSAGGERTVPDVPTAADPMEAVRSLVKRHGGGSGGG